MSGSSDTPRGWDTGGAETRKPKRKAAAKKATRKAVATPRKRKAKAPVAGNPGLKAGDKLLLGWQLEEAKPQVGFRDGSAPAASEGQPIWLEGEGHMITIAPTGAGKGRGALIPNLLTYEGPAIVIDPKGEACHITARRRREMGQTVHVIDPFKVISDKTDSLNPMDAFDIPGVDVSALALDIAKQLSGGGKIAKDPFWDIRGHDLSAGVIAAIAATREPGERNLIQVRRMLKRDDSSYNLAMLLDAHGSKLPAFAYEEISNFLQTTDVTKSGIHATACSYFSVIASEAAQRTVKSSTIDLAAVRRGDPMTIYLVVPPTKLASHAPLFRLWTAALMSAVLSREGNLPEYRTLFAIDECAQLGDFGLLPMVYTLARSYGMRVWAFFQDLAQIQRMLPDEWPTVLTNAAALQVFGVPNHLMASAMSQVLGDFSEDQLRQMDRAHLALQVTGQRGLTANRADYLLDPAFAGTFDPHPIMGGRPAM
ncbi:MAG: type IV secretory system conjugative DNA transfer family protein [Hyphomonas sp.]